MSDLLKEKVEKRFSDVKGPLPYQFDLFYDVKNTEELIGEVVHCIFRLTILENLCEEIGVSITDLINNRHMLCAC